MKLLNLHLNTIYSFLESAITPKKLLEKVKNDNLDYVVISEHNNFYSFGEILNTFEANDIKPIFGLDITVKIDNKLTRINVFAKNENDFIDLKKLSYHILKSNDKAIDLNDLQENYNNLIYVENPIFGPLTFLNKEIALNNHFYGINPYDIKENPIYQNHKDKCLIMQHNAILDFEENNVIKALGSIRNETTFLDIYEPWISEVDSQFEDLVIKTNEFVKSLYFEIKKEKNLLPHFNNFDDNQAEEYLKTLIQEGIKNKLTNLTKEYKERITYEFKIIKSLGFINYFLIVQDWINWAKNHEISIGPGRGSAAGSLISYLIGITEIDPIKHGLIFERFLNPQRVNMPDIDVDVQDDKRHLVIEYLINKYGYDKTANIVTYASLGKKSAIRDIMRIYNVMPLKINEVSKLIKNDDLSLVEEYAINKRFADALIRLNPNDPNLYQNILTTSNDIAGFYRQTGTHAAGIVLTNKPFIDIIPTAINNDQLLQTQVPMEYLEGFGLIKMDILGLKTLTTIKEITNLIKKNRNIEVDLKNINFNDQKIFDLLSKGNTVGIFQVESPIMVSALNKIKVDSFNDVVAIISLNRPGPMENIPSYARRKYQQEKVESISPKYDEILKETYGIIVYQEQIMQILQTVANMSFAEADNVRRIISKKKIDEMEKVQQEFLAKAVQNGFGYEISKYIFSQIEKFASYGFNKSHAVSYAVLTMQMAYLKAYYPLEFYAACISSAHGAQETINKFVNEATARGFEVVSPEINLSEVEATVKDSKIILPLTMIKGLGPETAKLICKIREEKGKFINFFDLLIKLMSVKQIGSSLINLLIKANTLRNLGLNQQTMLEEIALENSDTMLYLNVNLGRDYQELESIIKSYKPSKIIEENKEENIKNEIELLGQNYNFALSNLPKNKVSFREMHNNVEYVASALLVSTKNGVAKNGKPYVKVDLQDQSQKITAFVWKAAPELEKLKDKILEVVLLKKSDYQYTLKSWKITHE
ncbi:DNA polymerase III subunit alpha [[Mycoplasma] falconis]|uniref:DNA-directed DNA polymerase n=1 Tax=[Mycoplasma] falconis TaxID=92403 RepID=A0A501XB61_9BACT|nr:DNA polymerase III subunit alpha [[Mycoplasma] falconis]TPE57791.1 DNA polymerase III subunit alpha [[Mycoplasma] falconis]